MGYKINNILKLIIYTFLVTNLSANDTEEINIHSLLNDIEKKTDLSQKTKLENGGISFIFTRDDLERMQAKSLKDILKSTYPLHYAENRYGSPDPLTPATAAPFLSSMMRVFIDNQEITAGIVGSGILVLGDIDLGFVDHIEIYTQNPTYEYSTEATFVLVKLYSKVAQKDEGGKVELNYSSYGANRLSGYYSQELEDWSYFSYISSTDLNRKEYTSHDTQLSRDKERTHILTSLYNDNNRILLQGIKTKEDSFIGKSVDATPLENNSEIDFLHIGYDTKIDNLSFLATYDFFAHDMYFLDDIGPTISAEKEISSNVYTAELKYNYTTPSNKLILGAKYRLKKYSYDLRKSNGIVQQTPKNDTQAVSTLFLENQYSLSENSILTLGISASKVQNNYSTKDDDLLMYRAGHTYTTNNWVFKTIGSHVEISLDPYLVNEQSPHIVAGNIDIQSLDSLIEDIIYENENNKYELMLGHLQYKNYLVPTLPQMKLDNHNKTIISNGLLTRWTHNYNKFDKLLLTLTYMQKENLPFVNNQKIYTGILRDIKTYKKFDIFNEILFYQDDTNNKAFYDYSAGVKYHHTKDLTVSIKGENLLDKAKTTLYSRVNPVTSSMESPLEISPIDRRVTVNLEYLF